jgi:hypothetical protein
MSQTGKRSQRISLTSGMDDGAEPQSLTGASHLHALSSNVPATSSTSRKRKAPQSKSTNDDKNNKLPYSFSDDNRPKYSLNAPATRNKTTKPTSKPQQLKQKIAVQYPHSFSYELVAKRNPDEIKRDIQYALEKIFNLKHLRNLQPKAIQCALQLQSQMIVMATGGGK